MELYEYLNLYGGAHPDFTDQSVTTDTPVELEEL